MDMDDTLVEYFGNRGFQNCGYCKGKSCKTNYGTVNHIFYMLRKDIMHIFTYL